MLSADQKVILKNLEFSLYASYPGSDELSYTRLEDGVAVQVAPTWFEFSYRCGLTTLKHARINKFDPAVFLHHYKLFTDVADPLIEARASRNSTD